MLNFLKKLFSLLLTPFRIFSNSWFQFRNLYSINYKKIFQNKISFTGKYPNCSQRTYFSGDGAVKIGRNCNFGYKSGGFYRGGSIEIQARYVNAKIKIGNNISTNNNIFICAANYIEIDDDTLIGQYVTIMDHEAHGIHPNKRRQLGEIGKVIVGKNVWIGNNVTILKNSEIGDNTIIATGAIVSGKFPSNVVIGGVPAKIIKKINV